MATIRSIDFSMGVTTQELTRGLRRSRVAVDRWGNQVETRIHQVARATAASIGLFTAGITASVKAFVDFETALSRLATRTGLDLTTVVETYSAAIREIAETSGEQGLEIAEGIQRSISAGVGGTAARDLVAQAARFQAAGLGSIVDGVSAATTVTIAYKDATLDARDALDAITRAAQIGEGEVRDYANAFKRNAAVFETAGGSVEELGGALAAVAQVAPSVSEGATQLLRFITSGIIKPTERARKALARLNLPVERLRNLIQREGFVSGFSALRDAIGDDTQLLGEIFDSVEAIQFFENVTVEALQSLTEQVKGGLGSAVNDAFAIVEPTTRNQLRRLGEVISFEAADIGEAFLDIIPTDFVARLTEFATDAGNTIEAAITQIGNNISNSAAFDTLGAGFARINEEVGRAVQVIVNFGTVFIEALQAVYNVIEPFVSQISEIVNSFIRWEQVLRAVILILTGLVALKIAAFFGGIAIALAAASLAALKFLAGIALVGAIVVGIAAVRHAVSSSIGEIENFLVVTSLSIGNTITNLFETAVLNIGRFIQRGIVVITKAINSILGVVNVVIQAMNDLDRYVYRVVFGEERARNTESIPLFNVNDNLANIALIDSALTDLKVQRDSLFDPIASSGSILSDRLRTEFQEALDPIISFFQGDQQFTPLLDQLKNLLALPEASEAAAPEETPRAQRTPAPEEFEITLTHIIGQQIVAGIGSSIRTALKRRDFSRLGDDIVNAINDVLVTDVTNNIQQIFRRLGQRMRDFALQNTNENDGFILRMTRTLTEGFRNFFSTIGDALEQGLQLLLGSQAFQRIASAIGGLFNSAFGGLGGVFAGFFGGIFHQGGIVPGSRGQDVPIIAEAGEYVLTPDQVDQLSVGNRPIVLQMTNHNTGDIQRQTLEAVQYNAESFVQALGPALNLQYGGRGVV